MIYNVADTYFLFAELDGTYYDGHPVDLIFVYAFIVLIFAFYHRSKLLSALQYQEDLFSEKVHFETITKFGIPLTTTIICMLLNSMIMKKP